MKKTTEDKAGTFYLNKYAILLALVHYFIVLFFEKCFFKNYTINLPILTIIKLVFLVVLWQVMFLMMHKYKINLQYRSYIHFSLIYFIISFIILILVWPGNWQCDDLDILEYVSNFRILPWQSCLMSYFYYMALFIFPSPIFVIIYQLIIISLIVGYTVYALNFTINKSKLSLILYIPFLLPPVIIQNYFPLRATLFSYLVIFLIVRVNFLLWIKCKITIKEILFISIITSLVANIRGEGIIFLFFIPLILFIGLKKTASIKYRFYYLLFIFLSFFVLSIPQYIYSSKYQRSLYTLTTVIQPFSYLLMNDIEHGNYDNLNEINDVIDTTYSYPYLLQVFWMNALVKNSYQDNGNKLIFKTYKNLIIKYPISFLKERYFNMTNQMHPFFFQIVGDRVSIQERHRIYRDVLKMRPLPKVSDYYFDRYYNLFFKNSISDYINFNLRIYFISKISFSNKFIDKIIFNYHIPLFLLLLLTIFSFEKRKSILFLSFTSIWTLFLVVFLSAPESRFMYFFSIYLSCYLFSFYELACYIFSIKNAKSDMKNSS